MTEKIPSPSCVLTKEVRPRPMPTKSLLSKILPLVSSAMLIVALNVYAAMLLTAADARHQHDDVRSGAVGLIRSPERWSDHDKVSYRSWEADSVVVAVASPSTVLNRPAVGTHCYVRGATVIQVASRDQSDALLLIKGHADQRDGSDLNTEGHALFIVEVSNENEVREVGDCPDGTMFIVSLEEAQGMIRNERTREERWERDGRLLHGYAQDAGRPYGTY